MTKKFKSYKKNILWVFGFTLAFLVFLTFQAVEETENWKWFDLDYTRRHNIISAYGTLIGGILAFMSILFVLFQVYEQREQLQLEKQEKIIEERQDYLSRLRLLNSFLKALILDIERLGEDLQDYCKRVRKEPSSTHFMHFYMNSNFSRVIDMDVHTNYKAFQLHFPSNEEWEMLFLNFYSRVDLYSDKIGYIRNSYNVHIREKEENQRELAGTIEKFMNEGAKLIDEYIGVYGREQCFNHPWSSLVRDLSDGYHKYILSCVSNNEVPNTRFLSDHFLKPFITKGIQLRDSVGYDVYGSRILIELAASCRKKNQSIEVNAKQHAESLEQFHDGCFDST